MRLAPWLALAAASTVTPGAPDARLAVVAFDAPEELRFSGKRAADALAVEAVGGAWQVMGPEAVERRLGREGTQALSRCAADARCLAGRAGPLGVERVVGGFLVRAGAAYRVVAVLADVRTGRELARFERLVPIAARRLESDVVAATPALLRGERDGLGRLTVVTDEPGLTVAIDGVTVGTTPVTREVRPGSHEVRVWGDGWARADPVWVDVAAGGEVVHRPRVYDLPARELGRRPRRTQVEVVR
jgi:hypothetical protein